MKVHPRLTACLLAGGLFGSPAAAESIPSPAAAAAPDEAPATVVAPVGLSAAFEAAWQRALSARESAGRRDQARAEQSAAQRAWVAAPALELGYREGRWPGPGDGREAELALALPLWLPGQRDALSRDADAGLAQARAEEVQARLALAGEVREAAWSVAALQAEVAQALAQQDGLQQLAADVQRRVQAGDLARSDALAVQAEVLAAAAQSGELQQRLRTALSQWTLLTGLAELPRLDPAGASAPPGGSAPPLERHPTLRLAEAQVERARRRVDWLQHTRREAPELQVGLRHEQPGAGQASRRSLNLGLRLPFSIDAAQRPQEAAARAELEVAQARLARLGDQLDLLATAARQARRAAADQLDAETSRARLLQERAALLQRAFLAGEAALPELLRARAEAAQAERSAARRSASLGLAQARLEQAQGSLP